MVVHTLRWKRICIRSTDSNKLFCVFHCYFHLGNLSHQFINLLYGKIGIFASEFIKKKPLAQRDKGLLFRGQEVPQCSFLRIFVPSEQSGLFAPESRRKVAGHDLHRWLV
ncbi:hypothetical protein CPL00368_CDS0095 [Klebsiella phage DevonBitter]